jgi:hypothetical protein
MSDYEHTSKNRDVERRENVSARSEFFVGKVKWFGGMNHTTGKDNDYGFISFEGVELYVSRRSVICHPELLKTDSLVIFRRSKDKSGREYAYSVHSLLEIEDGKLRNMIARSHNKTYDLILNIAIIRDRIAPLEDLVISALESQPIANLDSLTIRAFWKSFKPRSPYDPLFRVAPVQIKREVCKKHYAFIRRAFIDFLRRDNGPRTSLRAADVYQNLTSEDRKIAAIWAEDGHDATRAKMLSARAAEKAVSELHRLAGASVEDVSITQLYKTSRDWKTHDLCIDRTSPIDVKNARTPINSRRFYVEHTIPQF